MNMPNSIDDSEALSTEPRSFLSERAPVEIKILKSDLVVLVDAEDAEMVAQHVWRMQNRKSKGKDYFYAYATVGGKNVYMHRWMVGAKKGQLVDHRDTCTLNNRRKNLRVCTHAENMRNCKVRSHSTTGVKGVQYDGRGAPFRVRITINGRCIHIGRFKTLDEAAAAYRTAAVKYHGEFANFG